MSDFSDFFMENVESPVQEAEVKLERFKKPIKLRSVSAEEQQDCQTEATERIRTGKRRYTSELNTIKYSNLMLIAAIQEPNLNSTALQDSWGVNGAYNLMLKMFTPGELTKLRLKMNELNGLADDEDEDEESPTEEAKN